MKLLPALLLIVAVAAHAQSDDTAVSTHATLMPCPNGPGVAVVAVDEAGNETWAGCWGGEPPERHRDEDHHRRTHNTQERTR